MSETQTPAPQLDLPPAGDATQSSSPVTAEKPASAEKPKKRARRGPPADGAPEPRVTVLLTTSRLSGVDGGPLRRGQAVSVPERRIEVLIRNGKVRRASDSEIAAARRRAPLGELA